MFEEAKAVNEENKEVKEKAETYNYEEPIDFRPNRIDDRLNRLDQKVGDNSERLVKLEVLTQNVIDDIGDIKTNISNLSDKIDGVEHKLTDKFDAPDRRIDSLYNLLVTAVILGVASIAITVILKFI